MTREGLTARRGESSGASRFGGPVLVVGAGVAGLTTALALRRHGIPVTVLERGETVGTVGAGIQVTPNGMAVLGALGVADRVRERGLAAVAVELRRAEDDRRVVRMSLADRDWTLIHRASLIEVLRDAAADAGARIETATTVDTVSDGDGAARLTTLCGSRRDAALVVGADGLHSVVRSAVGPAPPARFTGQIAWRAIVRGAGPAVAEVHMAPGRHVVTYPLSGGLRNLVAIEARGRSWAEESWTIPGDREVMLRRFGGVSPRLSEMLAAVEQVNLWGLHKHPVAPRWHGDRVVLAGDSAHPTLPFLAQGANMALEDAWALAACLAALPLDAALPAYEARRRDRARRIVAASGGNAWVYHMWRGPQRRALHLGIDLMERLHRGGAISRFDWIYGHDETRVPVEA